MMNSKLSCVSFHSVKGGVGKSTLATMTALSLARRTSDPVWLVDMDLTGTSLADVLPLQAPEWRGIEARDPLPLDRAADGRLSTEESRSRMERRGLESSDRPIGVPFLNDYLLFASRDWDASRDLDPHRLGWTLEGAPENLRVIPSSALPSDLERILPVIFREEESAFIESRLEWFLSALSAGSGRTNVVFDTPPTIPGLSRSVLSLAHRLTEVPKRELSDDGGMPPHLRDLDVDFRAFLVATLDHQDLRAAVRWLGLVPDRHPPVLEVVLNRVESAESARAKQAELFEHLQEPNPLLERAKVVEDHVRWRIFRDHVLPDDLDDAAALVAGLLEDASR